METIIFRDGSDEIKEVSAATPLPVDATVTIGDITVENVDVVSLIPGVGATNLGKAEDAAHTSGDTGVMALAVRNDAGTTLVGADGDYAPLSVNANGHLNSNLKSIRDATVDIGAGAAGSGTQRVILASDSLPSLNGAGAPIIDSYGSIPISAVTGANQVLIAAPGANKQIWVYGYSFTVDTAATTVSLQDEDDLIHADYTEGFMQYGGIALAPIGNYSMPLFKVATNKALEADVATGSIGGALQYAIVSV
jgi:hypothetical protein